MADLNDEHQDEEGWMVYMAVRVPFYKKDCENDLSQKQRGEQEQQCSLRFVECRLM